MKLHVIDTGFFKLDGGAMFGVVPKSIWHKLNPADSNNMCTWAMRCLLIEDGDKLILIDNGMGNKQNERFFGFYHPHGEDTLEKSINKAGFSVDDITDNFLTHLHFDHCGGGTVYNADRTSVIPLFKNASYWSNEDHWKWATEPNEREKASFLKENILPMQEAGHLRFINPRKRPFKNMEIFFADGHTDKQMLPMIQYQGKTIVFVADLIPSVAHIPLPYIMAYDMRPLTTMDEKEKFLQNAADNDYILFFEHDPINECCTVQHTPKGVRVKETFKLKEIL